MYILNMKNSKFIIDKLGKLFEQGIISSKDLSSELFNILKSKRDEIVFKMKLVSKYNNKNIQKDLLPRIYINGRKNLINRCLNNIIDNALKYGNKVEIKLSKENSNLLITIDDDGSGVPQKEYENVFKPFYKIDKGRAETKSSVGLGLSIASDIVKSHGGNIILNKSKMNGLSVKISLPV